MNRFDPHIAAERARDAYRKTIAQFEPLALEEAFPESVRSLGEQTVARRPGVYEGSKNLETGLDAVERAFDAAGQGPTALNRKIIDIAQRNINSGFDLAKSLVAAKNVQELLALQAGYWHNQFGTFSAQAEELRALSTKVAGYTIEPINARFTRGSN